VFWRHDAFAAREPKFAQWVLDDLQKHSRWGLFHGRRLVVLLQSDDLAIRFEPVGACAVHWERTEGFYVGQIRWSERRNKDDT
jgi:hypothetical protein